MAKKPEVNKTQAVLKYLKAHRGANRHEISEGLKKQGIDITPGHVATIKSSLKRRREKKAAAATAAAPAPATEAVAATTAAVPAGTIALEHVKAVARTVQAMGGFDRLKELLEVIREVGGLKRFRDLLEAMAIPTVDKIPF
jgi:hypothetical protein